MQKSRTEEHNGSAKNASRKPLKQRAQAWSEVARLCVRVCVDREKRQSEPPRRGREVMASRRDTGRVAITD